MVTLLSAPIPSRPECIVIVHHHAAAPDLAEWTRYCAQVRAASASGATRGLPSSTLVFTDKVGPSASQRREAAEAVKDAPNGHFSAVVCTNPIVRGICTAMGWLGVSIRAFNAEQVGAALGYVGIVEPSEVADARNIVRELSQRLPLASQAAQPFING